LPWGAPAPTGYTLWLLELKKLNAVYGGGITIIKFEDNMTTRVPFISYIAFYVE